MKFLKFNLSRWKRSSVLWAIIAHVIIWYILFSGYPGFRAFYFPIQPVMLWVAFLTITDNMEYNRETQTVWLLRYPVLAFMPSGIILGLGCIIIPPILTGIYLLFKMISNSLTTFNNWVDGATDE